MAKLVACIVTIAILSVTSGLNADERNSTEKAGRSTAAPANNSLSGTITRVIDERIDAPLKSAGIPTSPVTSDAEFIRRVHLDLHGVVPTAERVRSFLDDSTADKRARLIDQ